jgi:uncharacterized protein
MLSPLTSQLLTPHILTGRVYHTRSFLRPHQLDYRVYHLWLPLSQREQLSRHRLAPFALPDRNFGPRTGEDLGGWIWARLAEWGVPLTPETGEVVLVTMASTFGFGFNPITFWLCFDRAGALRAVLNEVHNTFGEQHFYLCRHPDHRPIGADDALTAEKVFHVSPFFARRGFYTFRYRLTAGETVSFHIDYHGPDGTLRLKTGLAGRLQPLTRRALWRCGLRWPLQPLIVLLRIHTHAWRLWRLGIPYRPKPAQRDERITASSQDSAKNRDGYR